MLSWAAIPLLAAGVDPFRTARVLGLVAAVLVLVVLRRWLVRVRIPAREQAVVLASLVPFLLAASVITTPDLLLVAVLLAYLDVATGPAARRPAGGVLAGALAGTAYLTKLFALPFVLAMVPALVLLQARRGQLRSQHARTALALHLGVFLLIVGAWGTVLSVDLGRATVGTAASVNLETTTPGSLGTPMRHAGLLPPPHPASRSAWEDPAALASDRPATGRAVPTDDPRDDPRARPGFVESRAAAVVHNLDRARHELWRWRFYLPLVLLLHVPLLRSDRRDVGTLVLPLASAIYVGGLLAIHLDERYAWFALLALLPGALAGVDALRRGEPAGRLGRTSSRTRQHAATFLLGLVLVTLLVPGTRAVQASVRSVPHAAPLARTLEPDELRGVRVASDSAWVASLQFCLYAGCRYYGVTTPERHADWREQLDRHDIAVYLVWDVETLPAEVEGRRLAATSRGGVDHELWLVAPDQLRPTP